jgi:hypothetical protein
VRRVGTILALALAACSLDGFGLAPADAPLVEAGVTTDVGASIDGSVVVDAGGGDVTEDRTAPLPDGGDLFLGPWAAEWWNRAGSQQGECNSGDLFADNGAITTTPKATSIEDELRFPRGDHKHWKQEDDGPVGGVQKDFCGRFTRTIVLAAGSYILSYRRDDGLRVYVDGVRVVNDWDFFPTGASTKTTTIDVTTDGPHAFTVIYRDVAFGAFLSLSLVKGT